MTISGTRLFADAEVLYATDVNRYLMRGVKVFADAATRDAAYGGAGEPTLYEGEVCYLLDTNKILVYDGTTWQEVNATPKIRQVINANKSDTFSTTSTTFTDVTGLSCTITPSASTSQVFIMATLNCFAGSGGYFNARLVRGATAIAVGDAAGSRPQASFGGFFNNQYADTRSIMWLDSPATTSATTYKVQVQLVVGSGGPTIYVNRTGADTNDSFNTRTVSSLTVLEVTA